MPKLFEACERKQGGSTGQCTLGLYRDNEKKMETTVGARVYFPPILENQMGKGMENEAETTEFRGYIGVYIGNNAPQPTHPKTAFLPPSPQRDPKQARSVHHQTSTKGRAACLLQSRMPSLGQKPPALDLGR